MVLGMDDGSFMVVARNLPADYPNGSAPLLAAELININEQFILHLHNQNTDLPVAQVEVREHDPNSCLWRRTLLAFVWVRPTKGYVFG